MTNRYAKALTILGIFVALRLTVRYLLPLVLPFLLGGALALAAEPMTAFLNKRLHMPRGASTALGVTMTFTLLALALLLLAALVVRELGVLAGAVPDLGDMAKTGLSSLSRWLQGMTRYAPKSLQGYLSDSISEFFSGGSALLDRAAGWVLEAAGGVLRSVPDGALGLGTAMISAFMISARLPQLRSSAKEFLGDKLRPILDSLERVKGAILGWLTAQVKLIGVTWAGVSLGFLLLRIPYAILWAALVAIVDALPILGTGTVLLPWSLICLLQGDSPRAIGLIALYAAVTLIRSALEPKLVGKQLGLDPLVTLFALYTGYKLWGLLGMLAAPVLAVAVAQFVTPKKEDSTE